ncbi:MAG: glycosyltransferase [Deltaproteobacteria bacterium]|nr:glycosyltransferase [Deltaproteobacteria bacterium]
MKILLYSSLAEDTGGAIRAAYIREALERCGHDVVYVKPLKKTRPLKFDFLLSLPSYTFAALTTPCHVAMAIKPYPNTGLPLLLRKMLGTKIVIDVDDLDYAYREGGIISWVGEKIQKPFPRLCDMVTYHNDNLFHHLTEDFNVAPDKLYRLDQGIDIKQFDDKAVHEKTRKNLIERYDLKEKKIVTYVAHLDPACDLDAILEGLPMVREAVPDFCLVVVGGGLFEKQFRQLAERLGVGDCVRFTGLLPKEGVIPFIAIADCCVVYYKDRKANYCRTSMKLREYISMGKRVVCNDVSELAKHKDYTYQTKTSVPEFSRMLIDVLKGKSDGREERGKTCMRENFSWDVLSGKLGKKMETLVR